VAQPFGFTKPAVCNWTSGRHEYNPLTDSGNCEVQRLLVIMQSD
jgi:hypothetical protein